MLLQFYDLGFTGYLGFSGLRLLVQELTAFCAPLHRHGHTPGQKGLGLGVVDFLEVHG